MTPPTIMLVKLLQCRRRQQIFAALQNFDNPELALSDGSLARKLDVKVSSGRLPTSALVVGMFDKDYPHQLKNIPDPPLVLYLKGRKELLTQTCIAVIGARRCSHPGRLIAKRIATELAANLVVVSGLALGIDGAAHQGVLESSRSGQTIAVLGAGLERLYPARHASLAEKIVSQGGLLVSEYPAEQGPRAYQFPERNRIISGLSVAVVVVEAGSKSGSLITARLALEQGRDVLAVPGPLASSVSSGCHRLIQQGAGLVTCAQDVFDNIGWQGMPVMETEPIARNLLTPIQVGILHHLQGYPTMFDEIAALTDLSAAQLSQELVTLELEGIVEQGPLGYIRTS